MIGVINVSTHEKLHAAARVCVEYGYSIDPFNLPWFIQLSDDIIVRRNSNSPTARPYLRLLKGKRIFANLVLPSSIECSSTPWELQVLDTFMLAYGHQLAGALLAIPEIKDSQVNVVEFDEQDKQRPIHEFISDILV